MGVKPKKNGRVEDIRTGWRGTIDEVSDDGMMTVEWDPCNGKSHRDTATPAEVVVIPDGAGPSES